MAPSAAPASKRTNGSQSSRPTTTRRNEDEELKPYVIVGDLGKGSFATVYRGYNEQTHLEVAIKTVNRSGLTQKLFDNLQGEIGILKTLSHRHITRLLDIIHAERNIYLIIEFCSGGDLANYLKKRGRVDSLEYVPSPGVAPMYYPHPRTGGLDIIVVRSFLRQLARALKFLRVRNLIHRDIKPQNLLLKPASPEDMERGHPLGVPILKIADFGFARNLSPAMLAETLCGSPLYMAPEILRYEKYDAKADLWSVGAVLYEMSIGKPPFRAQNHIELIKKIDNSKGVKFPDEDSQLVARQAETGEEIKPVPSDIKQLIRSLLKKTPAERMSFDDFFASEALAKSKFPRPQRAPPPEEDDTGLVTQSTTPEHHKIIPPEVLDPKAMIPQSRFDFRRRGGEGSRENVMINGGTGEVSHSLSLPRVQHVQSTSKPVSNDGSVIPGETDEDGLLRREYVLVDDKRAVELNRAVDEIAAARRKPLRDRRSISSPTIDVPGPSNGTEFPTLDSPDRSSPISFPPPPLAVAPPISSSPSSAGSRTAANALTQALNFATKKLFGGSSHHPRTSPYYKEYTSSSPKRQQFNSPRGVGLGLDVNGSRDPMEDELLGWLEELAQKTEVLVTWADEMYESVKAVPQKPLPDPAKFVKREREADRQAARRRNADIQAESNAMTCIALYMLLMTFCQKAIDKLRNHHEHLQMRDPDGELELSEGFDEALTWFKDQFIKCHERATLVKTWLPAQYSGPPAFLDQLVYDRALQLSRTAARKELLDQASTPDECEKLYEQSLWCLYALQDDLLQTDNPFMEEDRVTISTWVKRTKLRLVRCRVRMGMNDRDRLRDARLDKNLDDVPRDPPPWEVAQVERRSSDTSPSAEPSS
ncbi:unnamed protein product [Somion occarium]|uniref:non-specific serine/threonine protein kinase n=1 Tax=Somion occarium TaxID=3059160 RepID=A0ABP1DT31_9APHY